MLFFCAWLTPELEFILKKSMMCLQRCFAYEFFMNNLIRSPKLNPGDKVAIVTLSWGGPGLFPDRYEIGKERLESIFGLEVIPSKHALSDPEWIAKNPQARADDLMKAFADPQIKGIFSSIGGDDSIRLLPFVDLNVIRNNPKIFLGFSDATVTHFMCLKAGLRCFYGPAVMTAFAENICMHDYTIHGIKKMLFSDDTHFNIPQNTEGWTSEFLDWANPSNQALARKLELPMDWNFIGNVSETVQGPLIGGCVEVLQFMIGTSLWPNLDVWEGCILFLETSEEGIEPIMVTRFLRNLAAQGILQKIAGILFSKPGGVHITATRFPEYDQAILRVFEEYALPLVPIVTQMDFGHTDPMWVLPYGGIAKINPEAETVSLLE